MSSEANRGSWGLPGGASLAVALAGLFVGGFGAMGVAFLAVVLGFFGTRKGQRLASAGMILGAAVLIYTNLFTLGVLHHPLGKDRAHLIRSLEWSNRAHGHISAENLQGTELTSMLHTALEEARKVNAERVDARLAGFAVHFRQEYMNGLELMIQAADAGDRARLIRAGGHLDAWGRWSREHHEDLADIGRGVPSVAAFAGIL